MKRSRPFLASLLLAALATPAFPDTVTLKSNDTLTGTITRIAPDTIDLQTDFAGLLHIHRDKVKTLRSDDKVTIINPQGQSHAAYVSPIANAVGWKETESAAPPDALPPIAVAANPATPATAAPKAVYLDLEPWFLPIGPHWKNQLTLGAVATSGNTDSSSLTAQATFKYEIKPEEINLKIGADYAVTSGEQTSDDAYFDAVYRRSFPQFDKSERWYAFAENHELYDAVKDISLRSTTSFGPGYYLFKGKRFNLDLRAGPAFVYERFFNHHQTTDFDGLFGLRAAYIINDRTSLTEDLLYTTAVEDSNRYQVTSDTALAFKLPEIARGAGLKLDFRDDYDNTADSGNKHNDTKFTLGLTLDF
ncbi:MAG: DUF481 domain-containing protein [Phycisphaerae bacterium]